MKRQSLFSDKIRKKIINLSSAELVKRVAIVHPGHSISFKSACALSDDSGQPAHPVSLRCSPDDVLEPYRP